ncbi:MAG: CHAD domain-containing protein, partial [Actinomycetes bacterium]
MGHDRDLGSPATRCAGDVVVDYLRQQVGELLRHEPQVRADDAEAVHDMRVATRRMRTTLAVFRPLFDRARTDPVRDELSWLADALGAVRDLDVLH